MDRLALTGLALVAAGAFGFVASEAIGTAHASRSSEKLFLVAVSSGSALRLIPQRQSAAPAVPVLSGAERRLECNRVVEVTSVSLGFRCRGD